jgi:hypothetical protein
LTFFRALVRFFLRLGLSGVGHVPILLVDVFLFAAFFFALVRFFLRLGFSGKGTVSIFLGDVFLFFTFFFVLVRFLLRLGFSGVGHVPTATDGLLTRFLLGRGFFIAIVTPFLFIIRRFQLQNISIIAARARLG